MITQVDHHITSMTMNFDINDPNCDVHEIWFQFFNHVIWSRGGNYNYSESINKPFIFRTLDLQYWIRARIGRYVAGVVVEDEAYRKADSFLKAWEAIGIIESEHAESGMFLGYEVWKRKEYK